MKLVFFNVPVIDNCYVQSHYKFNDYIIISCISNIKDAQTDNTKMCVNKRIINEVMGWTIIGY